MARNPFYQAGKAKPQYGRARWTRFESLREKGFSKTEAREYSRIYSPQGLEVVANMVGQRQRWLNGYLKSASDKAWSWNQAKYYWNKSIVTWYNDRNLTSKEGKRTPVAKGGRPDLYVWYHIVENRVAKDRGWQKGDIGPGQPSRRPKPKSPPRKDGKGNVRNQRARAKSRSKAFREVAKSGETPIERQQKRDWINMLRATAKKEPWRDAQLTEQAKKIGFSGKSLLRNR